MSPALRPQRPLAHLGAAEPTTDDVVAVETAVALEVNGISQAVMMASPADLEDFALGLALTEGWISERTQLLDVEQRQERAGLVLALRVSAAAEHRLKARRRSLAGRTGCGLCGIDSLAELEGANPRPVQPPELAPQALAHAMAGLRSAQPLNQRCGGLHAAAWCNLQGQVLLVREDIGRHNALDKLIGALHAGGRDPTTGFMAVSSRASYELVHKAAMAGCGLLASISAPSSLAIDTAQQFGLALWAFVRDGRATRYA